MKTITRATMIALITFCFTVAVSAATFNVNTQNDVQDAAPGDGVCASLGGGGCSIRAAITEANALAGDDIINIPANHYIQSLVAPDEDANAGGDWDITSNITINGSFGINTTLQAMANERVMEVASATAVVSLNSIGLLGGNKTGAPSATTRGGGIRNQGTLTIFNCDVRNNTASGAGGIRNERTLTLISSSVTQNTCNNGGATCFGGGIYNNLAVNSTVTIVNSRIADNISNSPGTNGFGFAAGLGIEGVAGFTLNISGSLITNNIGMGTGTGGSNGNGLRLLPTATSVVNITNTRITNNSGSGGSSIQGSGIAAFTGVGGTGTFTGTWDRLILSGNIGTGGGVGIFVNATSAPITMNVINSTINNNLNGTAGGGIALTNVGGTASSAVTFNFLNSTLSGNTASTSGGGIFVEQPVAASAVTANFNYCTISNNTATTSGGGIFRSTAGTVNIKNSIVANNTGGAAPDLSGTINSQDYNHFESTAGATITGTTTNNATGDPAILPLADNGGPTQTHLPSPASPVLNTIPNGTNDCGTAVTNDQHLRPRPSGAGCDKGSVELAANPQHVLDFDGNGLTDWVVSRNFGQILWCVMLNNASQSGPFYNFGNPGDKFVPADYDGDGRTEIAFWRPSTGLFMAYSTASGTIRSETFGVNGDDPSVVGDYNGDGKDDIAVYRSGANPGDPSTWYWRTVQNGPVFAVQWGQNGDSPAPGDYDGDGKNDFVIQRDKGGQGRFWRLFATGTQDSLVFGNSTDIIAPGDYDGDGKTDICVVRDKGGQLYWWMHPSGGGADTANAWGLTSDVVAQGDYDGDGKTDRAIWRSDPNPDANFFYVDRSFSGGLLTQEWGQQGDYPVANYNTH